MIEKIASILNSRQLLYNNEAELQNAIERALQDHSIEYLREYVASRFDRPDFFVPPGLVIEVKIQGSLQNILRQLKRYADLEQVQQVILVCPKPYSIPATLSGKPVWCHSIWKQLI